MLVPLVGEVWLLALIKPHQCVFCIAGFECFADNIAKGGAVALFERMGVHQESLHEARLADGALPRSKAGDLNLEYK